MRKALILVDIQNDYFKGGKCELYQADIAAENAAKVLEYFRKNGDLVIFIQHLSTTTGATFFIPDTEGVKIHKSVNPRSDETILQKNTPNSFYHTDLKNVLEQNEIQSLVVCGMMSHMCIDTTVRAARDWGYLVTLLENACTTKELIWKGEKLSAETVHKVMMVSLQGSFADVISVEQYLGKEERKG